METNKAFFEDLIRDRRLSLRQLAKRMDILPSQLSLTFNGKRRMQISEAVKIAQILGTPINEVMVNAGIEEAAMGRKRCKVVGAMAGIGVVNKTANIERTIAPEGLPTDSMAIQARTAETPLSWMDGWVFFCTVKQSPEELLSRFCYIGIDDGQEVMATIQRGYTPGTYNLSGPYQASSQRLSWACPVVQTRN